MDLMSVWWGRKGVEEGGRGSGRVGLGVKTWVHQSRRGLASAYADGFGWGQSVAGEGGAGR